MQPANSNPGLGTFFSMDTIQMTMKADKNIHMFIEYKIITPHSDQIRGVPYYFTLEESVPWTLRGLAKTLVMFYYKHSN